MRYRSLTEEEYTTRSAREHGTSGSCEKSKELAHNSLFERGYLRGSSRALSSSWSSNEARSSAMEPTQGSITSPKNKPCPTLLKPWTNFPVRQPQLFERICEYIPRDAKLFRSTQYLTELGQDLCGRPLASEKDLEPYQRLAVERPTTSIVSYLQQIEEARRAFNVGEDIIFENHANTLSNSNEEVRESLQNLRLSTKEQSSGSNPNPRNADQICIYKEADGTQSLYIVVEYKPAHKLSVCNLRAGLLRADNGSINIPEDVINRITIPTDLEEKFVYYSEQLTAAALTQTYGYMIKNGLEYGKLATGEADVFL